MTKTNKHLRRARVFAKLMDNQFSFFGIRFGLDNIIGLAPGVGDIAGLSMSFYLIWVAHQMELPTHKRAKMIRNVVIDTCIGFIPVLGDLGDLFFKANTKNLQILEDHDSETVLEGEVIQK